MKPLPCFTLPVLLSGSVALRCQLATEPAETCFVIVTGRARSAAPGANRGGDGAAADQSHPGVFRTGTEPQSAQSPTRPKDAPCAQQATHRQLFISLLIEGCRPHGVIIPFYMFRMCLVSKTLFQNLCQKTGNVGWRDGFGNFRVALTVAITTIGSLSPLSHLSGRALQSGLSCALFLCMFLHIVSSDPASASPQPFLYAA